MLKLTTHTTKSEFIAHLKNEVHHPGVLEIEAISLPPYLSTVVSITVFSYEISKYPRKIRWISSNRDIANLLKSSKNDVIFTGPSLAYGVGTTPHTKPLLSLEFHPNHRHIDAQIGEPSNLQVTEAYSAEPTKPLLESYVKGDNIEFTHEDTYELKSSLELFNFESLLHDNVYHPSPILSEKPAKNGTASELDDWISRIEQTKQKLSEIRKEEQAQRTNKKTGFTFPHIHFSRRVAFATLSLIVLMGLAFTFFANKPTVYTVEVTPTQNKDTSTIDLHQGDFQKIVASHSITTTLATTGDQYAQTDKASGKVRLTSSGGSCSITNGGFYVAKGDNYYRAVKNGQLGETIVIPANSKQTLGGIDIDVIAEKPGADQNLGTNELLRITNLYRNNVGTSCTGLTISEIKDTAKTSKKQVSQEDLNQLSIDANEQLAQKRKDQITALLGDSAYLDDQGSWIKTTNTNDSYSAQLGAAVDNVSLTRNSTAEIYYLPKNGFNTLLGKIHPDILNVTDVTMLSSKGNLQNDDTITLTLAYTYTQQPNLDINTIQKTLNSSNFSDAKQKIKDQYSTVNDITKQNSPMPNIGNNSNIKVNINEK